MRPMAEKGSSSCQNRCQAEKRFTDPFLLAVTQGGADVALALLNRRRGRFYVGETGDPAQDAVFAEHGGILVRAGAEAVLGAALSAVLAESVVSLPGIDATQLAACEAAGLVHLRAQRFAPDAVTREVMAQRGVWLAEICKQHGYRFSPRLHIDIWGDKRGV